MNDLPAASDPATADALEALTVIRTEAVLSRLPVHNLAKKGSVDVRITRRNASGEVELKWHVAPNARYGEPRQLAYRIDTLYINKLIDRTGRPLPRYLRLGSLRHICQELDLHTSGSAVASVKQALLQNATAAISAKVKYRDVEGREQPLEAVFTRYNVVFTDERLPSGEKADAVYVVFNDPYLNVLNNAPQRPLDYDYLRSLNPAAQRFYEILSFRIFAALRNQRPRAKMSYSEYCTFSAQQRYDTYDRVKKQMYKIHRVHLTRDYLKAVEVEPTEPDGEGRPDWLFFYTPGRRAKHEYRVYHSKAKQIAKLAEEAEEPVQPPLSAVETTSSQEGPVPAQEQAQPELQLMPPEQLVNLFHKLTKGIEYRTYPNSKEAARAAEFLERFGLEKTIYIIEYGVRAAKRTNFEMRFFGGLQQYVDEAAAAFDKAEHEREVAEAIQKLRAERAREASFWEERGEELLAALPEPERERLIDRACDELVREYPALRFQPGGLRETARRKIAGELAKTARNSGTIKSS